MHFAEKISDFGLNFTEFCSEVYFLKQLWIWYLTGAKPLPRPMMTQSNNAYMYHKVLVSWYITY